MSTDKDVPIFSFAIVSDSHLTVQEQRSAGAGEPSGNRLAGLYDDLVKRVNAMDPAFVVHLGDTTDPVPVSPKYELSAKAFDKASKPFTAPYHMVPGNHDIGEKLHPALPKIYDPVSITESAIAQYEQHFGPQRYCFEHEGCVFVVINTLLFNSGLEHEQQQWEWLERLLSDSTDKRIFVLGHYPLFLSEKDEPDYYDNVDEPARSRMINLLETNNVEAYYCGHVHNFFYNNLNGTHHYVVPSTGIIRTDYMEMFRAAPTREMGSFDPAKLGFLWVDVYPDKHVPHLIRNSEDLPHRAHSWSSAGSTVTMDLRIPWCDEVDIPSAWGLEIFERKNVRNDYPLAALWEMGVTDLRIPISDLLRPRISRRVKQLAALGHRFTVVMFGPPNEARRAALSDHSDGIKAVEIVSLFDQWQGIAASIKDRRPEWNFEVYLNAVRPEVEGWTTHHGMHVDLTDEIDWVLSKTDLADTINGFVFGIRRDVAPFEGLIAVEDCLADTNFKPLLHVPGVSMFWGTAPNKKTSEAGEIARVAEATLIARARPDLSVVIDNFVEIDQGYCSCRGLVDRFYNPKDGSRVVTSLNTLLPSKLRNLTSHEASGSRILSAESDDGTIALVIEDGILASNHEPSNIPESIAHKTGKLINLLNGKDSESNISELIAKSGSEQPPRAPQLLFLKE